MITQKLLTIKKPRGFHLITSEVLKVIDTMPQSGLLNIFCQHTSAGLTINENCDPSVRQDFETVFNMTLTIFIQLKALMICLLI